MEYNYHDIYHNHINSDILS